MATWADEYITLIEDCEQRNEELTEWELTFIDSLRRQIEAGRHPSVKRIECLDKVWERATKKG